MSHDTTERPADGAADIRERLNALGRAATAGSMPWPGVDDAIRRRRRTRAVTGAALGSAVVVTASLLVWGTSDLRTTTALPATGGDDVVPVPVSETPPWPVPTAPYRPVYESVTVDFPGAFPVEPEACNATFALDLHEPERLVKLPYDPAEKGYSVAYSVKCEQGVETGTNLQWNVPTAHPQGDATTPEDCAGAFRTSAEINGESDVGAVMCLLVPPDAERDRPLMIVRLEYTRDATMLAELGFEVSAWTGGPPTMDGGLPQLDPPSGPSSPQPEPEIPRVSAPFRTAYEDVPLHLPGKPEGCDEESLLHLHVPEVSRRLAESDAFLTPPCVGDSELQLGEPRGAVLEDDDVTAEECAAALAGDEPEVAVVNAREGMTLCLVAESHEGGEPEPKLVALTVTEVDERSGAFDLSATAWTGTVTRS
jgi:hypothetical protein